MTVCDSFVNKFAYALVLAYGFVLSTLPPAVSQADGGSIVEPIKAMEHRFFFRQYIQDPVEKRLERLELLVFGSIQTGTNLERMQRLKTTIADRDCRSASAIAGGQDKLNGNVASKEPPASKAAPRTNYPALSTLEWRVLKKTYPTDSLDQRLARLETKIFGQSATAMSYVDRLERLQRTAGIDVAKIIPSGPLGPAPKASPRKEIPRSLPFSLDSQSQFAE
ncbi:MAG: hypothetical protein HY711_02720, partial [Candidatus Melainabacteria bacterium]|nr:hypothetical protein [Candidatus Melainabacteria bacterium]